MKSKKDILAFLDEKKGVTISDELAIKDFCSQKRTKIDFKLKENAKITITFTQFQEWYNFIKPTKHSIIVFKENGVIGIVKEVKHESIILAAHIMPGGDFIHWEKEFPLISFELAENNHKIILQREFNKKYLSWNKHKSIILDNIVLTENLQVRVSVLGEKVGLGVFREIDDNGSVVMYVYYQFGANVKYSLYEVIGKVEDFQFDYINLAERRILNEELEKSGKTWNGFSGRVEPKYYRVEKGKKYYYFNNYLRLREIIENDKPKDLEHSRSGNYFRSFDEGIKLLDKIHLYLTDITNTKFEPDLNRVKKGDKFYYIDDYLKIREVIDNYKPKDYEQFESRNYFRKRNDAEKFLEVIVNEIKTQLSQPETGIPSRKRKTL